MIIVSCLCDFNFLINLFSFQNQMVQGVACLASNDGDIHIPGGGPRLIYVHISLGKIDLFSHLQHSVHYLSLTLSFHSF